MRGTKSKIGLCGGGLKVGRGNGRWECKRKCSVPEEVMLRRVGEVERRRVIWRQRSSSMQQSSLQLLKQLCGSVL